MEKLVKMLLAVVLLGILALSLIGCEPPQEAGYYERLTKAVNTSIDAQQESSRAIVGAIEESQLISAEKLTELEGGLDKVDKYIDVAQAAAKEAARVYEEKRAEDGVLATIEAVRAANLATTPINPYAGIIEAMLGTAAVLATAYGVKKRSELGQAVNDKVIVDKKLKAHERGTEAFMRESDSGVAQELFDIIGTEREKLGV